MMNTNVQEEIVKNIVNDFDEKEKKEFIKMLVDECIGQYGSEIDLIDCINVESTDDYWGLEAVIRDEYMKAYLKMHI